MPRPYYYYSDEYAKYAPGFPVIPEEDEEDEERDANLFKEVMDKDDSRESPQSGYHTPESHPEPKEPVPPLPPRRLHRRQPLITMVSTGEALRREQVHTMGASNGNEVDLEEVASTSESAAVGSGQGQAVVDLEEVASTSESAAVGSGQGQAVEELAPAVMERVPIILEADSSTALSCDCQGACSCATLTNSFFGKVKIRCISSDAEEEGDDVDIEFQIMLEESLMMSESKKEEEDPDFILD